MSPCSKRAMNICTKHAAKMINTAMPAINIPLLVLLFLMKYCFQAMLRSHCWRNISWRSSLGFCPCTSSTPGPSPRGPSCSRGTSCTRYLYSVFGLCYLVDIWYLVFWIRILVFYIWTSSMANMSSGHNQSLIKLTTRELPKNALTKSPLIQTDL